MDFSSIYQQKLQNINAAAGSDRLDPERRRGTP
jgi:hypothetical protein